MGAVEGEEVIEAEEAAPEAHEAAVESATEAEDATAEVAVETDAPAAEEPEPDDAAGDQAEPLAESGGRMRRWLRGRRNG